MNIEQTCKVMLSAEEVREALTDYIREHARYKTHFRAYDECIAFETVNLEGRIDSPTCVVVLWGEAPEPVEEPVPAPSVAGTGTSIPPVNVAAAIKTA